MKDKCSDRYGEAARAAKAAIEDSRGQTCLPPLKKIDAKEMRGDCYTAEGRINGK